MEQSTKNQKGETTRRISSAKKISLKELRIRGDSSSTKNKIPSSCPSSSITNRLVGSTRPMSLPQRRCSCGLRAQGLVHWLTRWGRCLHCIHFRGGSVIPRTQYGRAASPLEDKHTLLPKVKARREGLEVVIDDVSNDTTEQQGDVACASVVCVVVGIGSPPSICWGLEGSTSSWGLGAWGRLCQPVQFEGWAGWRTIRSWPSMVGNGRANNWGNNRAGLSPVVARTTPT